MSKKINSELAGAKADAVNGADGNLPAAAREVPPPPTSLEVIGKREYRTFSLHEVRVEKRAEGGAMLVGYASVFDSESDAMADWGFREVVRGGAFAKTIQESDVRALINHDSNLLLGRRKAGTLRLAEDDHGLRIEIDPPNTTYANDLLESMSRGDLDQMSFAFRTVKDRWTQEEGQLALRELLEVELYDVSPVTFPAYESTAIESVSLRDQFSQAFESVRTGTATVETRALVNEIRERLHSLPEPETRHSDAPEAGTTTSIDALRLRVRIAQAINSERRS